MAIDNRYRSTNRYFTQCCGTGVGASGSEILLDLEPGAEVGAEIIFLINIYSQFGGS